MDAETYSPSMVVLSFGGYTLKGWERISIRREAPVFRQVNGIRGKNTRIKVGNTAATVKIVVPQTSTLNPLLSELVRLDDQYGTGRISMVVKDLMGTEVFSSEDAYVENFAEMVFGDEISAREWTISCLSSETDNGEGWGAMSLSNPFNNIFG